MAKLSDNEIKRTTKLLADRRYAYAIDRILDQQRLYLLEREENGYAASEIEGIRLVAIWPAAEYAEMNIRMDWADFRPKEVSLGQAEALLEAIESSEWNLDVFPMGGKTGLVVTVEEFINDLNAAATATE